MRYFIEQKADRYFDDLAKAKAAARRISAKTFDAIYVIAEEYDSQLRDYMQVGQVVFYSGIVSDTDGKVK